MPVTHVLRAQLVTFNLHARNQAVPVGVSSRSLLLENAVQCVDCNLECIPETI